MADNNPVQNLLDQLKNEFIAELPDRIASLETLILGLDNHDNYEEIYRFVHSLKGIGGTHGIQIISVVCHQLETYLEKQHESNQLDSESSINHCLKYIDLLEKTYTELANNKTEFHSINKLLNEILDDSKTNKYSVLLLDSSKLKIEISKQCIASLPITIESHDNGLDALELLLHKKYDLLITGMEISSLNGEALIAAVRLSNSINKNIKTILLTTQNTDTCNRLIDPNSVILRSAQFGTELNNAANQLLKEI